LAKRFPRAYWDGKRQLQEAFDIEVVESRHALADIDWLAAHPEARASDLMEVMKDPAIQGVVSTIGGDDSIRMLPFLDYSGHSPESQDFPRLLRLNRHPLRIFEGWRDLILWTVSHGRLRRKWRTVILYGGICTPNALLTVTDRVDLAQL
jgi:muramoyltetrapeptide carboxypeptidase LdcA involved in peptidoglycan recycling